MLCPVLQLSLASAGAHFARHFFTVFAVYLIERGFFTPAGYGALLAISSFSSILAPIYSGWLATSPKRTQHILVGLTGAVCASQVLFALSVEWMSFQAAAVAWFVFGLCASSVTSLQRTFTSYYLQVRSQLPIVPLCLYLTDCRMTKAWALASTYR